MREKRSISGVVAKPLMKRISADAPRCGAAGPGVPDDAARRVLPAVHRAVVSRVHDAGLWFPRPVREADGVRDAGRGGPVAAVAARPGALFLLPRSLESR